MANSEQKGFFIYFTHKLHSAIIQDHNSNIKWLKKGHNTPISDLIL